MTAQTTSIAYSRRATAETSVWYVGNLFSFLADSVDTGGAFSLIETLVPKGGEPPRHVHHREDESFYILDGAVTFYVGDEVFAATAGDYVFLPRGVPHSFALTSEVAKMLVITVPGGFEGHFRNERFAQPAEALTLPPPPAGPPDIGAMVASLAEYGIEVVGPPGPPQPR